MPASDVERIAAADIAGRDVRRLICPQAIDDLGELAVDLGVADRLGTVAVEVGRRVGRPDLRRSWPPP